MHAKQKMFEAVNVLVGNKSLNERLTYAASYMGQLQETDFPQELRTEFLSIRGALFKTALSNEYRYEKRDLSWQQGTKLAKRILGLYTAVMGGL